MIKKIKDISNLEFIIIQFLFLYIGLVYFSIAISNIFLGMASLVFIYGIYSKKIQLNFNKYNWYLYAFIIVPFVLTVLSVLYSNISSKGLKYLWLRLPILIIPFVLLFMEVKNNNIKSVLKIFVLLTVIASLKTIYNAFRYINEEILFVPDFTFFITIIQHPYFGIFILIAFVSIIELRLIKNNILKISIYILLILTIALTTSRLVYLLLFLILGFYLIKNFSKQRALLLIILLSIFTFTLILSNKNITEKFLSSVQYENSPRLKLWNNANKVLVSSNNVLLGIGIGDFYENKKDPYFLKESEKGIYGYNPHSQIVEFYVTNGVLGLIILIITIIFGIRNIKKQNNFAIIIFVIIIMFSLTESILSRQFGVQLYSVFIPLIFKENFKKIKK